MSDAHPLMLMVKMPRKEYVEKMVLESKGMITPELAEKYFQIKRFKADFRKAVVTQAEQKKLTEAQARDELVRRITDIKHREFQSTGLTDAETIKETSAYFNKQEEDHQKTYNFRRYDPEILEEEKKAKLPPLRPKYERRGAKKR